MIEDMLKNVSNDVKAYYHLLQIYDIFQQYEKLEDHVDINSYKKRVKDCIKFPTRKTVLKINKELVLCLKTRRKDQIPLIISYRRMIKKNIIEFLLTVKQMI